MDVVKTKIGGVDIFIESAPGDFVEIGGAETSRYYTPTSTATDKVVNIYEDVKTVIRTIASDFGELLTQNPEQNKPEQVELKLSFSLKGETKAWVLSGEAKGCIDLTFTWKNHEDRNSQ